MPSFDIVSRVDLAEVANAVNGVLREISQRYDFKDSRSTLEHKDGVITILADDEMKLRQLQELLKGHCARRKVDANALDFAKPERAAGQALRQTVTLKQGIDRELAKRLIKDIKGLKFKVQASVQGDELRISGKKRDELQKVIAHVKGLDVDRPLQFRNFRD